MKSLKKYWFKASVVLASLVVVIIIYTKSDRILAETEKNIQSEQKNKNQTENSGNKVHTKLAIRALDPVKNDSGLQATSKPVILGKNEAFPDLDTESGRNLLFSELVIPNSQDGASYEYVNSEGSAITPSSAETGFQRIYVKIIENHGQTTILVPIPVSVTDADTTLLLNDRVAVQTSTVDGKIIMYPNDIQNKKTEQLQDSIKNSAKIKTWNTQTGEDISVNVVSTTINTSSVGMYKATFEVTLGTGEEQKAILQKDILVFGANVKSSDYITIDKGKKLEMGTNATNIFTKYQTSSSEQATNATYEWVSNKEGDSTVPENVFDSTKSGLQWGFIKMTDRRNSSISTVISIPVTVTAEEQTTTINSEFGLSYNLPIFEVSELKDKTTSDITNLVSNKLRVEAWKLITGETIATKVDSSLIKESTRGTSQVTITIMSGEKNVSYTLEVWVLPDSVFKNQNLEGWEYIPYQTSSLIKNPFNNSYIGFPNRGINNRKTLQLAEKFGFMIKDGKNVPYVESTWGYGMVADIPGVNGKPLYNVNNWDRTSGIGYYTVTKFFTSSYFLRKGNELKQIIFDKNNEIAFVYSLSLSTNVNFLVELDMYNLSSSSKSFSMLEKVDTSYYGDTVPIYSLQNNGGFYLLGGGNRLTLKLKKPNGSWISDYSKYRVGYYSTIVNTINNIFGNDYSQSGQEVDNKKFGDVLYSGNDSGYQLGAPWKMVSKDQALNTGYEVFLGNELPYMNMKGDPEVINVYNDDPIEVKYKLSKIPSVTDYGKVYVTYPNNDEEQFPFMANESKEFDGKFTVPKSKLTNQQNETNPVEYQVSLLAVNEADGPMKTLPSQEDYEVKINIYKFGGTAKAQVVKKDSVWSKTADALIKDPIVLPGHTAGFEYVNKEKPIDTSKEGFQYVDVRMTDNSDPTRTTIIKVPVMVVKGSIPTTGLLLGTYDIATSKSEVADLTDTELDEFILKKSEAVAWDVTTGLSKDVELSVIESSLVNNPDITKTYTATIQAKKGTLVTKQTIRINFGAKLTVNFLDKNGSSLQEPYTIFKGIGESVELSKMTEITDILTKLKNDNYELVKKPEEESFTMVKEGKSVAYQFNGFLTLLSAPSSLDFETKQATINAVKFTDPKVIGKSLVVSDTRADKSSWALKAKIDQPLTSLENKQVQISNAIKYQYKEDELTLTDENVIIFEHLNTVSGNIDVTKEHWSKGDGFILDLAPGAIKALGKYQAKITITLENAK